MIETNNARFSAKGIAVMKDLKNGEEFTDEILLECTGSYKSWWEYPCEPQYGKVCYVEQYPEADTIKLADDFKNDYELIKIIKAPKEADWEVVEESLED